MEPFSCDYSWGQNSCAPCVTLLSRLKIGSVVSSLKSPELLALGDIAVPPTPDGRSVLLGIPCQSLSLITVSEAYWGNLLRAVTISYLCASFLFLRFFQVPATGVP